MLPESHKAILKILSRLTGLEPAEIKPDLALLDDGILTSLQVVELVAQLEKALAIQFLDEDVNPDNFYTLRAIETLVQGRLENK